MSSLTRTYSSPNLKDQWQAKEHKFYHGNDDEEFYVIGDRVFVDGYRPASVAYFGELDHGHGGDWVGVVLDAPTGTNDGRLHGRVYFQCAPSHGLFVRPHRVTRMSDSALGSSNASSRLATPLPTFQRFSSGRNSRSPGGRSSTMDSYYYDDDYRQGPTIDSLERKLKSILSTGGGTSKSRPGILKRPDSSASNRSGSLESKADELVRRIQAISNSPSRAPVFNFRPKRAQLEWEQVNEAPDFSTKRKVEFVDDTGTMREGDRVVVKLERGSRELTGVLRYLGEVEFALGQWAGVELDLCEGKNDGSVLNRRYFQCPQNYGLFLPASRVRKCGRNDEKLSQQVRSTIFSPPPHRDSAASRSSTPYDDEKFSDRPYSSNSTGLSSPSDYFYSTHPMSTPRNSLAQEVDSSSRLYKNQQEMFNDHDLDRELKKSLSRTPLDTTASGVRPSKITASRIEKVKPVSVVYTFISSKYDGCPIAKRTVQY